MASLKFPLEILADCSCAITFASFRTNQRWNIDRSGDSLPYPLNSPPLLKNKPSSGPAFLSVLEASILLLVLFSFALFTFVQSFIKMLVLWLEKLYPFHFDGECHDFPWNNGETHGTMKRVSV
ncbi:Uncharacterized protein Rs2_11214 [Raphanus sativus]|nr:Uncharacterized protein Rs2_11214 [Raphanus sativus]